MLGRILTARLPTWEALISRLGLSQEQGRFLSRALLLALGVLGTGIAIVVYLWLVDNVGSVRSSLVTFIIPIVGLFLGWAVLDESIGASTVLGCALIIVGITAVIRGQAPSSQRLPATAEVSAAD
jgi:drug/metabolite transporter (DMT)-like permease